MKYPNLFKIRYRKLEGRDWLRSVDQEDRQAFARIGMEAHNYGRQGGRAIVKQRGKEYMREIGSRGAAATNEIHAFNRAMEQLDNEDENPIAQNAKYDWSNFARDLAWAEGRLEEEEVIDVELEDAPPALPSGDERIRSEVKET